jgi:hypothetical protein
MMTIFELLVCGLIKFLMVLGPAAIAVGLFAWLFSED